MKIYPVAAGDKFKCMPFTHAIRIGRRKPLAGEVYISGAIPEAYVAPNNLSTIHEIGILIKIRKTYEYQPHNSEKWYPVEES